MAYTRHTRTATANDAGMWRNTYRYTIGVERKGMRNEDGRKAERRWFVRTWPICFTRLCLAASLQRYEHIVHVFECGPHVRFELPAPAKLFIHEGRARRRLRMDTAAVDERHDVWVALNARVRGRPIRVDFNAHDTKTPNVARSGEFVVGKAFGCRPPHRGDDRRAAIDTWSHRMRVSHGGAPSLVYIPKGGKAGARRQASMETTRRGMHVPAMHNPVAKHHNRRALAPAVVIACIVSRSHTAAEPKISNFAHHPGPEQDVAGGQVTVDEIVRAEMGLRHRDSN